MPIKRVLNFLLILFFLAGFMSPQGYAQATAPHANPSQSDAVTPDEIIVAMNALRVSNGLRALIEDPIIDSVAQYTAEYMAANEMSWHIGNVRGRIQAAGYGGGATVWATENFAYGNMSIDEIMAVWADPQHMLPATVPAYCHVGAGVAKAPNGFHYYILQAAYTESNSCGPYTYNGGTSSSSSSTQVVGEIPVSQIIIPVKTATPDADGKIFHVVESGQSFWAIAIAYHITIHDIEVWNNISRSSGLRIGQKLFIPTSNTEGYATPTPVGMVVTSTPDADGKIIHVVQPYQTLITIAQAYNVSVDSILALNGLTMDSVLQIGEKLLINGGSVTPSATPRPLSPVEKLTPASDGKYYHVVQSGETLSWIASLYNVTLANLLAWNGLNSASILLPGQKILLEVTPPATITYTPGPATATRTVTPTPVPPTATSTPSPTAPLPTDTATPKPSPVASIPPMAGPIVAILAAIGLIVLVLVGRKKA